MTHPDPLAGIPASTFSKRRAAALRRMGPGVMVLPAAPQLLRSRDTEHAYRPDSELYYLSGVTEAGSVAVLVGGEEPLFALFVRDRNPEAELWTGPLLGPDAAGERYGADVTYGLSELSERLPPLLQRGDRVFYRLGRADAVERVVLEALAVARARGPRRGTGPRAIVDPGEALDELRLRKDVREIERLRSAAALTLEGHHVAASVIGPGRGEWAVQAAIDGCFRRGGASGPAYETIVGSGANACVLHYVANRREMQHGELVLIDAGAELALYAGDVTRTYPVGGRFSAAQRAVYDVVEAARAEAVARVAPGVSMAEVHDAAVRTLVDGLVSLGVLHGAPLDLIEGGAHRPFYPHQTSHWLGLDVHDPGNYARAGVPRALDPGMVFTVEPALYFRPDVEGGAAPYAGLGVRIEDDVLVTRNGCENLTAAFPTAAEEIEALSGGRG
jgi:Xaa-Pro aminopeptidase